MSEPVFQSSLGSVDACSNSAERTWNDGSVDAGMVTKMHHKRSTADTAVVGARNEIKSRDEQEGRHAPLIISRYAGYDDQYDRPYGEFIPYQPGDRPIVVYANNEKSKPVIVGVTHHSDEDVGDVNLKNILPAEYPIDPHDKRESLRQIWIHRSQDAVTIDGDNGEFEISSHTKSFIRSCSNNQDDETFDYEDLVLKDKKSVLAGEPKTIHLPKRYSFPLKYFAVFRNKYEDTDTDYLRFCVDASEVSFKWMQQKPNDDKLTYAHLRQDGTYLVRRHLDTSKRTGSRDYAEACIHEDGSMWARRESPITVTECEVRDDGAYVTVGGGNTQVQCTKDQIFLRVGDSTIDITGDAIRINSPKVLIN